MADREVSVANWFSTTLTSAIADGDLTIPVDTIGTLTSPCIIVIDPDNASLREVVLADGSWGASAFVCSDVSSRGLAGSADGAQAHDSGVAVEVRPLAQHIEDLHDRVDAADTGLTNHQAAFDSDHGVDHDARDHDALNIDAATLDGIDSAAFALLAGADFTGAVSIGGDKGISPILTTDLKNASAGTGGYPAGLSIMLVSTATGWPSSQGTVVTFIAEGTNGWSFQWFYTRGGSTVYYRMADTSVAGAWEPWATITTAENPGTWEVDNYDQSSSVVISSGSSMANRLTVTLSIPSDWPSWKCHAIVTGRTSSEIVSHRVVIDGQAGQTVEDADDAHDGWAIQHRVTGLTTTGSRTVAYQATDSAGFGAVVADLALYARAVRTG